MLSEDALTEGMNGLAFRGAFASRTARRTRALVALVGALGICSATDAATASLDREVVFDLPPGALADSLDRFGAQSGLQIVYDLTLVEDRRAPAVAGSMATRDALDRLLAAGLTWERVNDDTIALRRIGDARVPGRGRRAAPTNGEVTGLGDLHVMHDPRRTLPLPPSSAALGFNRSLVETPRSVSVVSVETIDLFGLSAVEDLVRVAPGVYTTTRWGIQGSIDVRNVPADTYFRGMKRLNLQGHGRSVLAAMETIEIVKGPPSPIYGMGKIGGYTNMVPKSVRATAGGYLLQPQGFVQTTMGSYDRAEVSFGVGGPLPLADKQGGYYVYGLLEDSGSFVDHVAVDQRILQVALTVDDFVGPFRLETGVNLQRSRTAGALIGRFTQDVADTGRYVRGTPLVDLDADGNGRIGYLEMHAQSPVRGDISAGNRPLRQVWDWPLDADGDPLPLDEFPAVPGIPEALYDYLVANPDADPTGLLRAQGSGGPPPASGYVPAGFALDPRTVSYGTLDLHRTGAFERDLNADFAIAYLDLVNDRNPNFTMKNQLFLDSMNQYKLSEQPFSQIQKVFVLEDKITATRRLADMPAGPSMDLIGSMNVRYTSSEGRSSSGDYATHRSDAMSGDGLPPPNATFATALLNPALDDDGLPWTSHYDTDSWEIGAGMLLDVGLRGGTSVVLGARMDRSRARNVEFAGTLDLSAGSAVEPAVFRLEDDRANGTDTGVSWSVSASHPLGGIRPYASWAETSLALDRNNNKYDNPVIDSGHIGEARLIELGVKGSLLGDRLFFSVAAYEQGRLDASSADDAAVRNAHVSATVTQGWEGEMKWEPSRNLLLSFHALRQKTRFEPNAGASIMVDARTLGFTDVVDDDGNVVYPAEAFLYGGRSFLVLPSGLEAFESKQGNPDTQIGLLAQYELDNGVGFLLSGNYFSSVYAGRLTLVRLPKAYVLNAGVFWDFNVWRVKCDVLNMFDERYFRARTGDTLADSLVSAMPGRRWQVTFRMRF